MPPQEWRHEDFAGGGKNNFGFPLSCGIIPLAMKNCANSDFPRGLDVFIFTRPRRDFIAMLFAMAGFELRKKFFRLNKAATIGDTEVEEGFVWDWASTRAFAKMLGFGSLLHDFRYRYGLGKLSADWQMFLSCVRWDGANPLVAALAFVALAAFGWGAYWRHLLRLNWGWFAADAQNWLDPIDGARMTKEARQANVMAIAAGVELPDVDEWGNKMRDFHIRPDSSAQFIGIFARRQNDNQLCFLDILADWEPLKQGAAPSATEILDFTPWRKAIEGLE